MFDFILKIFLLVTPIICLSLNGYTARFQFYQFGYFSSSVSLLQFQFFQYGVIMLFLAALFDKPKRFVKDKYIGILFFIYILSIYFHPSTIKIFGNIFSGFLLYFLVLNYTKNIKSIFKVILVVASLNTLFAILQFFDIYWIYSKAPEITGLMVYKTHLGIYQAIAIPICWAINPWLAVIPAIGLLLSKSMTAMLATIIGLIVFFRKKIIRFQSPPTFLCVATLIGILIIKSYPKLAVRFNVWGPTFNMIKENWMLGYGFGKFKYVSLTNVEYSDPYSLYLGIAHAAGIFGLIALWVFIIDKFRKFYNYSYVAQGILASCLILMFVGFGYSFLDYPRLAGTAITLFALLTITKGEQQCL